MKNNTPETGKLRKRLGELSGRVPAHCNVHGNELADQSAKEIAQLVSLYMKMTDVDDGWGIERVDHDLTGAARLWLI